MMIDSSDLGLQENSYNANTGVHSVWNSVLVISKISNFLQHVVIFYFYDC